MKKHSMIVISTLLATAIYAGSPGYSIAGDGNLRRSQHNNPGQGYEGKHKHLEFMRLADTNHDKRISQDEFRIAVMEKAKARFAKMDRNHDGFLDKEDRGGSPEQMFEHLDANHDGSISKEEFREVAKRREEHRKRM